MIEYILHLSSKISIHMYRNTLSLENHTIRIRKYLYMYIYLKKEMVTSVLEISLNSSNRCWYQCCQEIFLVGIGWYEVFLVIFCKTNEYFRGNDVTNK